MLACKWCKLSVSLNTVCLPEDLITFPSDCLSDNVMTERSRGACSWDWTLLSTHNKSLKTPPFLQPLEAAGTELCLCTTLSWRCADGGYGQLENHSSSLTPFLWLLTRTREAVLYLQAECTAELANANDRRRSYCFTGTGAKIAAC